MVVGQGICGQTGQLEGLQCEPDTAASASLQMEVVQGPAVVALGCPADPQLPVSVSGAVAAVCEALPWDWKNP